MDANKLGGLIRLLPLVIGLFGVVGIAAKGCQTGPFGRTQLVKLNGEQELALGAQAFSEVLSKSQEVRDRAIAKVVTGIGRRLAKAAETPELRKEFGIRADQRFEWEFKVIEDEQVNAFCLPGGKVVVYTGIVPVCETEAGLAVVMGHEIGHALARHGSERMAQQELAQVGQMAVASSLGGMDANSARMVMGALSAGTQLGLLKYSRKHESEADHIGIILMAQAGYDPGEASRFWMRMAKATGGGKGGSDFMSTHPSHETRIADLANWYQTEAKARFDRVPDRVSDRQLPRPGTRFGGIFDRDRPEPRPQRPAGSDGRGKGFEIK